MRLDPPRRTALPRQPLRRARPYETLTDAVNWGFPGQVPARALQTVHTPRRGPGNKAAPAKGWSTELSRRFRNIGAFRTSALSGHRRFLDMAPIFRFRMAHRDSEYQRHVPLFPSLAVLAVVGAGLVQAQNECIEARLRQGDLEREPEWSGGGPVGRLSSRPYKSSLAVQTAGGARRDGALA